jgi:hypothetical protein
MNHDQDLPHGKESDFDPDILGYPPRKPMKSLVADDMNPKIPSGIQGGISETTAGSGIPGDLLSPG